MRLLPCGDRALLAEFDTLECALAAQMTWSAAAHAGIVELVPGARTVLVRIDPIVTGLGATEQWLTAHLPADAESRVPSSGSMITVPVSYDGDDLAVVAEVWGCSLDAVAARHAATEWVCAFIGFTPGFGYLTPVDADLPALPRRATSRAAVPPGSVALAAEYCGIYPRESPGGWQLIGRTAVSLWDAERDSPALVTPGTRVRFEAVHG
ncbi:5-oxoprolinase subunit B family protein [Microcella sp.]|uniref:5-oxoprolinase subunit B family protein n=1 Tax=Microcella sp. TaxID=1913979 RepID=UPI00256080B4|nr:allophanate hydrolase subunit 1 [Microcella sp.]MBX9471751.1 allophanate hydrolase subunit 1 [Microcella sp.]